MTKLTDNPDDSPKATGKVPWFWFGMGVILTVAMLAFAFNALIGYLAGSGGAAATPVEPIIVVLTAPPTQFIASPTAQPRPTAIATATPVPTIDVSVAPPEITVGYYAKVGDTGGVGVTVRNGASTRNQPVTIAPENSIVYVFGGPVEADTFRWWQVRMSNGTEGWVAGQFITPAAAP